MKITSYLILLSVFILSFTLNAQDLIIYNLEFSEENKVGFVSLSDQYLLSEHPDSLAIPNIEDKAIDSAQYFKLDSKFRKRFLLETKISETDSVYIYDYSKNSSISYQVNDLDVVAKLSLYVSEDEWPYSQFDYMIGFEIDDPFFKDLDYSSTILIAVGKDNPFAQEQLNPVIWMKIPSDSFPVQLIKDEDVSSLRNYEKYVMGDAYKYVSDEFHYFINDFLSNGEVIARRLIVVELEKKEIVCDKFYYSSEGVTLAPLSFSNVDMQNYGSQWTGKLFVNKPQVIFGFDYRSFGCPSITFINLIEKEVSINCDNRH